jgi:hypothetical protein
VSEPVRPTRPQIDEYLDGLVAGAERAAVERTIAADARAAAEVKLQGEIDGSLKRLFAEPVGERDVVARLAPQSGSEAVARIGPRVRWKFLGLAAAVLLVGLAGLWAALVLSEDRTDRLSPLYKGEVANGFVPQEVCTDAAQFAGWTKEHYGQALYPADDRAGVTLVGWSYGRAVSNYSGVLLAKVEGTPVVVVVDKVSEEGLRKLPEPTDPTLHRYRKRVGGLVMYEVTPLDRARVLPMISDRPGKSG